MAKFTLPRTGTAPLTFSGNLLADADGEWFAGREQNRWHELALYRTTAGAFVLHIAYRTRWQGEAEDDTVLLPADAAGVRQALAEYDLSARVSGFPDHPTYRERQEKLLANIVTRYRHLVSELLAKVPELAEELA